MKKRFTIQRVLSGVLSLGLLLSAQITFGQNALQFTGVNATPEKAIQLHWASNTNEIYEIDYADQFAGNDDGSTAWNKLFDDYPAQGTNTFWLDTGNYYNFASVVPHPKNSAMRFYRVTLTGTNTGSNPTIIISSPTNGATVSNNITVTVSANSDQVLASTTLYVDGQEMWPSEDGTNFVINTCEWWNGQHTLFAVAKSVSHLEGKAGDNSVTLGRTASAYVNLTFNNLISEFAFSQPYFEPSLGQTQQVTANFAANCNWTLQILDVNSNTVRTATGSGSSMEFDWDGTGNGGTNLPAAIYNYQLSAQTNGQAFSMMLSSGNTSFSSSSSALSAVSEEPMELWALSSESSEPPLPLALYPPGFDTNDLTIFEASSSEVHSLTKAVLSPNQSATFERASSFSSDSASGSFTANASSSSSPASSQTTTAPTRSPITAGAGTIGTFGVGYQIYDAPGGTFTTPPILKTPPPIASYIQLDGETSSQAHNSETWGSILENTALENGFVSAMTKGRYKGTVIKANNDFSTSDLTGGAFNGVNVALVSLHCSYATTAELDGIIHTYLRFYNGGGTSYARLDDCSFGGSDTNGLKWMGLLACNPLRSQNYTSMYNHLKLPINNDLHLLCSASTDATAAPMLGQLWAEKMLGDGTTNHPPEQVKQAWFDAGSKAYIPETNHIVITFRVAGWPDAFNEHLSDVNADPGTGNASDITKQDQTVFSNP